MDKKQFIDGAKNIKVKQNRLKNSLLAFLCGGCVGLFGQLLFTFYDMISDFDKSILTGLVIVTIVFITVVLTAFGVYDNLAQKFGAGLFIPISGFANSLASCAMEGRSEGPIFGIGSNMFKLAGSVLTYGIVAAYIFGGIRWLLGI